jgi:trimethylamine--corrinoid protein Co-methyltransferase
MTEEKAKRQGGRKSRRESRLNAPIIHHPTLQRNIPIMEVTNQEGVEQIHDFSMRVVEQIGCDFQDKESLDFWRKTGAEINGQRVRIGRDELMSLIALAPSSYLHHARNPERTVQVGDGHTVVAPTYGAPFVLDMEGKRRYATLEDLNNFQKLNHMASSVHIAGGPIVEPVDVPVGHRHMHMAYSGLKYSDKPIIGNVTSRSRAEDTIDMMKIVFGEGFATNNTCTTSLINCNSPLVWDQTMLDALKVYASNNQAVLCSPFSMAAASTPASAVGTIGVVVAEALMAIALGQLIRPGCPMVLGVPAMTVALNTGAPVHGTPDSAMVQFLASAMARFYKLPHRSIANVATSKVPDMQAGYDSMWGLFPSMLSDANWITMAGGMLEGALTVSYAKTVLDFEQVDAFYHFAKGPNFNDLEEMFEMVKQVGPGGHFLGEAHTRKCDLFLFPSQHNFTYEQWHDEGRCDSNEIGLAKAKNWLAKYEQPPMDAALDEELLAYIDKRTREIPAQELG